HRHRAGRADGGRRRGAGAGGDLAGAGDAAADGGGAGEVPAVAGGGARGRGAREGAGGPGVGAVQLGGVLVEPLSRRSLLAAAAAAALMPRGVLGAAARAKSFLVIWLEGGPSQLETWDPHPGTAIGGRVGAVKTRVPGLEIADLYPRVAEQVHQLSVIRSLVSKEGDHERGTYAVKTGHRPEGATIHPSLGAIACHEAPVAERGLPPHVSLGKGQWPARGGFLGPGL